jgi:hypothetical protein
VRSRPVAQTLIICASILIAIAVVVSGLTYLQPGTAQAVAILGSILITIGMVVGSWQLSASRKAKMALTSGEEHRGMADEYRRLADMAITGVGLICRRRIRHTEDGARDPWSLDGAGHVDMDVGIFEFAV